MTTFDTLRLDALVSSPTNPRKNFNPVRLQELAHSIAASGVHQPILVRPLPAQRLADTAHLKPRPTHEIVAGERRYRASQLAKVDTIPAMIRALTDDQVLEIQIVENIQRDSLTELETAEGYQLLIDRTGIKPEEIGLKVGKSRSSVYGSLKLLDLHPASKDALRSERITASAALLIARIPDIKLQDKAVAYAATPDGAGDRPSYRTFSAWLQRNVMLNLSYAPFDIEVVTLVPAAGSCNGCKKRTDADPDLFSDISNAALCIDPPCYHAKAAAHDALEELDDDPSGEDFGDGGDGGSDMHALAGAAARQAKADPETALKRDIEILQNKKVATIGERNRIACFDEIINHIHTTPEHRAADLLAPEFLRAWLLHTFDNWQDDDIADALAIPRPATVTGDWQAREAASDAFAEQCKLRIQRAADADVYRYTAALLVIDDRESWKPNNPTPLFDAFAAAHEVDLAPVRHEAAEQVEDETKEELAAINQALTDLKKPAEKAKKSPAKTTSTPPPAGAAIDDAAADAKIKKPTPLRKAKTSAQEAISGIAAAMQGMEAEPLDASLGGSEVAAGDSGKLAVGAKVKILSGKHEGKEAVVKIEVSSDMWSVEIGKMFSVYLPTKSLEVIA